MRGDEAVSAVVGTILMLALVVAGLSMYQLTVVPAQTEKAEAHQMGAIEHGMSDVTALLVKQLPTVSHAPSSTPVTLSRDQPAFAGEETATGTLTFDAQTSSASLSSPNLKIVTRNGDPQLRGGAGQWKIVQDGETIDDIDSVIGLRLKITDATPDDNDRVQIVAEDAHGDYAGDFQAIVRVNQPNMDLLIQTQEPPEPGEVVFHNQILTTNRDRWDSHYWIDAMLDLYWFDSLLADASKPATLRFDDQGLAAEYKVAYERIHASGLTTIVGAGQVIEDYERRHPSGTIAYTSNNEFYPDQTLTVEHGALVRSQTEGSAFAIDPPIDVKAGGALVKIGLDIPSLEGTTDTVSGANIATVRTLTTETSRFGATAGEVGLTLDTDHPQLWADFLEREFEEAGLTSSQCPPTSPDSPCQFEVTPSSDSVQLEVHGPHATDADPQDPERDISLQVQRGTIQTEVQR